MSRLLTVILIVIVSLLAVAQALSVTEGRRSALIAKLRKAVPGNIENGQLAAALASPQTAALKAKAKGMTCPSCEGYVTDLMAIAADPLILNETETAMIQYCETANANDTTKKDECIAVALLVLHALPSLLAKDEKRGWDVPFYACAMLFDNLCTKNCCTSDYAPEQIYLSLADGTDFSSMRVNWVTLLDAPGSSVHFSTIGGTSITTAAEPTRTYNFGGWIGVVNTAVMTGLTPNTTYTYTVGSSYNRSTSFTFTTFPTNIGTPERPLRVVNIADMAYDNNSDFTVQSVGAKVQAGEIDMVIHNGDISYADAYMVHWDMFMRKISTAFGAYAPYMTNPGNHESYANFTAYKTRLAMSMPSDSNTLEGAMYYALNIGPTKILMMDSETPNGDADLPATEMTWANAELSTQDRKTQPWALVFQHRPLYCNAHGHDCKQNAYLLRLQAESTYLNNKVDLVGAAHVHYYLRSYPLSMGMATGYSYDNPSSPVYVVNGAAGNLKENQKPGKTEGLYPVGNSAIGYGVMEVVSDFPNNKHSMTYSFFDSATNELLDNFTITKRVN